MKDLPIYAKQTIEFVTVGAEFCGFIEKAAEQTRREFVDKSVKLLPLLYLKAVLLPPTDYELDGVSEQFVTEEGYEYVRSSIARLLGPKDDYLEVFVDDMQYSEGAMTASIAEDLADIYQDVRDFVAIYSMGNEGAMNDALARVAENFREYWGQKLVNTLRPLHTICFNPTADDDDYEPFDGEAYDGDGEAPSARNSFFDNQRDELSDDELDRWT